MPSLSVSLHRQEFDTVRMLPIGYLVEFGIAKEKKYLAQISNLTVTRDNKQKFDLVMVVILLLLF